MTTTLAGIWTEFVRDALTDEIRADTETMDTLRDTFFAGAALTLRILVEAADPDERLDALCVEAEAFVHEISPTHDPKDLPS